MRRQTRFKGTEIGMIPPDWDVKKLDEIKSSEPRAIAMGPFGSNIRKENYKETGVPIIRGFNLKAERFLDEQFVFLSEEKAAELAGSSAFPGDVIFVAQGGVGQVGIIPRNAKYKKYVLSQNLMKISCDKEKADPFFVFYFFRSKRGQDEIISYINPTGVPCISQPLSSLKLFRVPSPNVDEQKIIGGVLSCLDEKIELNQEMNKTLEKIGRALFKHWFIDFEFPDEKGKPYKSSGGKMVDSELGEIPEGWKVCLLPDVCLVVDCLHTKKPDVVQEGSLLLQVYNIATDGTLDFTEKYNVSENDYQEWTRNIEVKEGDCLITNAGRVGAVAQVPVEFKGGIGRNITAIRPKDVTSTYLFRYLFSSYGQGEIERQTDQGTVLDSLNVKGIRKIRILVPPRRIMDKFERMARPLREKVERNKTENGSLTLTRDSVLPELMSGKIRVGGAA